MSLFFTQYNCLNCQNEWVGVGMRMMGEAFSQCPECKSERINSKPFGFGKREQRQALLQENLTIKVYRTTPTAKLPTKAYEDDLGFDLYADMKYYLHNGIPHLSVSAISPWYIAGESTTRIRTGLQIELPKGYGAIVKPRSSQGSNNLDIYAGVEDGGYRGEWIVCVHNSNLAPYYINPGEKVGQFILVKNPQATIVEVQSFGQLSATQRGQKGFGSSGK